MSINKGKIIELFDIYPSDRDCRMKSESPDNALPSYEYLESLRPTVPPELYAYNLRALLQCNTANVPREIRLRMLAGVLWDDIMYQDELDAIASFDSEIIAYRGTDPTEEKPGISWTLDKNTASSYPFNRGRVFKAVIPKEKILIYFAHEENEK